MLFGEDLKQEAREGSSWQAKVLEISRATVGDVRRTHATTRRGPPHLLHVKMSAARVFWRNWGPGNAVLGGRS